jgi:hypothetical protein
MKDGRAHDDPPPAPEEPTHSPEGVDLTLVRWMLSLTPTQRLQVLQDVLWSLQRLRRGRAED